MKIFSQILDILIAGEKQIRKIQKEKRGKVSSLPRAMEKGETEQSVEFADHWMATWSSLGQHWKKWEWLPTVLGNSNLNKIFGQRLTVSTIIRSSKMNVALVIKQSSEVFRSF